MTNAVIFTHCADVANPKNNALGNLDFYIDEYAERFQSYFRCNQDEVLIGIVYGYIDLGVQQAIPRHGERFQLAPGILETENGLKGILKLAETKARRDLKLSGDKPPKFYFIGLNELVQVLNNLMTVDPDLVSFLGGVGHHFNYDSPKFVEAVIRLARGDIPHLARHPIIRVDDDAEVNPKAIRLLLNNFEDVSSRSPFYFFSGRYGRSDGKYDPVNDYAVRTHWFFPSGTKAGDERFSNGTFKRCVEQTEMFLSDLSSLGAKQPIVTPNESGAMRNFKQNNQIQSEFRDSPQVISGAGLIMGRRNVELLPPFMNFEHPITWVDDHLKRRLHEMLGDITPKALESLEDATFEQNRHKEGITEKDISETENWYFRRLLEGCLLHIMICDSSEEPADPSYAEIIRDIVWFKKGQREINQRIKDNLKKRLQRVGIEHYEAVLGCWSSDEFTGCASFDWAKKQLNELENERQALIKAGKNSNNFTPNICEDVVEDAIAYLDLLLRWHKFTRAIERLPFITNLWLFESVNGIGF